MRDVLITDICQHFDNIEEMPKLFVATLLDFRFEEQIFLRCQDTVVQAKMLIPELIDADANCSPQPIHLLP